MFLLAVVATSAPRLTDVPRLGRVADLRTDGDELVPHLIVTSDHADAVASAIRVATGTH